MPLEVVSRIFLSRAKNWSSANGSTVLHFLAQPIIHIKTLAQKANKTEILRSHKCGDVVSSNWIVFLIEGDI